MPTVLIFSDYFSPGYKAGGQIQTLKNFCHRFGEIFELRIITRDRDIDNIPYENISRNIWMKVGNVEVSYLTPSNIRFRTLLKLVREVNPDVIYHNGLFSFGFTTIPLILRRLGLVHTPVILPPRGELSKGAISIKPVKKTTFINFAKGIGIYKDIIWQASSEYEKKDIQLIMGNDAVVIVAPDLPTYLNNSCNKQLQKNPGSARVIFLSRIAKTKNLSAALKMLKRVSGKVAMDIYGSIEDSSYWRECKRLIRELPSNVTVEYKGPIAHDKVVSTMAQYHFFFLPTTGENFGYVILEAFVAGCPVIISDRTPWKGLYEKKVGWDLPLNEPESFERVLSHCVNMDNNEYQFMSEMCHEYGLSISENQDLVDKTTNLFEIAFARRTIP